MFKQIRNRLTLLYIVFMVLFLVAFGGISYGLLSSLIYHDQKLDVLGMVHEEAVKYARLEEDSQRIDHSERKHAYKKGDAAKKDPAGKELDEREGQNRYTSSNRRGGIMGGAGSGTTGNFPVTAQTVLVDDQMVDKDEYAWERQMTSGFSCIVSADGELLAGRETWPGLCSAVFEQIPNWRPIGEEVRLVTVVRPQDGNIHMIIAAQSLNGDGATPIVLAGREIGFFDHVLARLFGVLAVTGLALLAVASVAGYYLAGRAMVPITEAFQRQKAFVADASHELRTPLSVLQASLEVVEAEEAGRLSAFSQQVMADMRDEVGRMTRLVGDLLTLARADAGSQRMQREWSDLCPLVEQVIRLFRPLAEKRGIAICLGSAEGMGWQEQCVPVLLRVDRERMAQLVHILMDNALKYTPPGGRVQVDLGQQSDAGHEQQVLSVADTGIGIAPEHQAHIFERFYREDKARSRESGGAGLGLSIAHWIVTAHEGRIEVESAPQQGTVFRVILPVGKVPVASVPTIQSIEQTME